MHLQTERLILRPVAATDLDALYRIYGDPATNTFNPAGPHPDIEHSRRILTGGLNIATLTASATGRSAFGRHPNKSSVLAGCALSNIPSVR